MGVNQELKVLYNLKKNWVGVRWVRTKNRTYSTIYNEKGGSHICLYCSPNSQQSQNFGNPGESKVSHVYAKHTVNYALACLRRGHSRCLAPLTTEVEFYPRVLPSAYSRQSVGRSGLITGMCFTNRYQAYQNRCTK